MSKKFNQLRFSEKSSILYTNFFSTRALSALYAADSRELPKVIINDIVVKKSSEAPKGTVYQILFHFQDGRGITTFEFIKEYKKDDENWVDYIVNRDAELFEVLVENILIANTPEKDITKVEISNKVSKDDYPYISLKNIQNSFDIIHKYQSELFSIRFNKQYSDTETLDKLSAKLESDEKYLRNLIDIKTVEKIKDYCSLDLKQSLKNANNDARERSVSKLK